MLKLVIAFVPCWVLYLLGDLVSALVVRWDASAGVLHPVASRLLLWSDAVQEWAQGGRWFPWQPGEPWPDDDGVGAG